MTDLLQCGRGRKYMFMGAFKVAGNKQLLATHFKRWETLPCTAPEPCRPASPNLWTLVQDGTALEVAHAEARCWSDWNLVLGWITYIMAMCHKELNLQLEGQVGYQGQDNMDTGRLFMDSDGRLAMQTIKQFPGVIGAITNDNMIALKQLSTDKLQDVDFLGRSSIMLAALYKNFNALAYLLTNLTSIDWDQRECVYGENFLHIIARYRHTMNMAYDKVMALLPSQSVLMHALNTLNFAGVPPLTTAINHANDIIFHWFLRNGADVHGDINRTEIRPPNLPIVSALNSDETMFLRCLLELGASPPAHMLWLDVRTQEHFRLLVHYGKSSRDLSLTFSGNRIWPVMGSLYPPLITTYNEGVMHRRQLVTTILGTRMQPKLATDLIHLICKYADLLPLQQPQT